MFGMIARRLAAGALTVFTIASLCFFITRLAPGNPFSGERQLSKEAMESLNRYYGFDKPILTQYANTMLNYLQGDFGPSYYHKDITVHALIWPALKVSTILGAIAFCLALMIGIPLGVLGAARQNQLSDHAAMTVAVLGICVPNFLLGPLLKMLFAHAWKALPVDSWPENFTAWELSRLLMPAFTLALVHVAYVSRLARAGMLDVLNRDYIRTARAKGLSEPAIVLKHALKNAITPVVSYAGPMAAVIVTGSIVVEKIFNIPGLGQHFVKSALDRDHPLLMGSILVFSTLIILFNLAVDLAYAWLDPRVRTE